MSTHIFSKILLAGDTQTGRSTLLKQLKFQQDPHLPTQSKMGDLSFGMDFCSFEFTPSYTSSDLIHTFLIYDFDLLTRYRYLEQSFTTGTQAIILLFDMSQPQNFKHILTHLHRIHIRFANQNLPSKIPIFIVGTKLDLVQPEDIVRFHQRLSMIQKYSSMIHTHTHTNTHINTHTNNHTNAQTVAKEGYLDIFNSHIIGFYFCNLAKTCTLNLMGSIFSPLSAYLSQIMIRKNL